MASGSIMAAAYGMASKAVIEEMAATKKSKPARHGVAIACYHRALACRASSYRDNIMLRSRAIAVVMLARYAR